MARDADRLFALDVLRGIAVSLVLARHMRPKPTDDEAILTVLHHAGWTGVDLFFVLSGFLISGLLFAEASRTGGIQLRRFWLRRGLKIWPSYFAIYGSLAIATMLDALHRHKPTHVEWLPANLFFVQNYVPHRERWPHSWSIAIEEHFYLALPLVLVLLLSRGADGLRRLPWICAIVCAAVLGARVYGATAPGTTWLDFYYPTHYRLDSLLFGVLIGYAYHFHRDAFVRVARAWPALLAGMVAVVALAATLRLEDPTSTLQYTLGFTLLYLGFGGAVVAAAAYPRAGARNPVARAFAWMGVYSYTIYLCHAVVLRYPRAAELPAFVRAHTIDSPWTDRVLFCALSIGAGVLTSHLIERPFLRLRSRWLPSASPPSESGKIAITASG